MRSRDRTAFATLFEGLDSRAQRSFVADLYAARGWETRLEADAVVATREGETKRVAVVRPGRFRAPELPDVDVVVAAGNPEAIRADAEAAGVDHLTAKDLRDRLLYGLDRETAATVFADHFDRPLAAIEPGAADAEKEGEIASTASLPSWNDPTVRRVGVVVAVLLVLAAVVAGAGLLPVSEPEPQPPASNSTYTPSSVGAIGGERAYPPGLGPDGVENSGKLAVAHFESLRNRSHAYRMSASGPQHAPFMMGLTSWNATVRIENWTHYRYQRTSVAPHGFRVEQRPREEGGNLTIWEPVRNPSGENESGPATLTKQVYANGTAKFWRYDAPEQVAYRNATATRDGRGVLFLRDRAAWVDMYLVRFLWTADSTIRCVESSKAGDCLTFQVEATGQPVELRDEVADYRAVAMVDRSGLVRSLTVRFTIPELEKPEERVPVSYRLEYTEVGNGSVSVSPPDWLDAATNRSASKSPYRRSPITRP